MLKRYFKILDLFILKKFLSTFFFAILILAVIACVIDYSQKIDYFVENKAPTGEVIFYFVNFVPHITALLFPLFIFIATIFFTSKMAYKTEVIATLAAGVSFQRFLRPYVIGSFLLGIVSLLANHWVVPEANKNITEFHIKYIWPKKVATDNNVHLRLNAHTYVYIEGYNFNDGYGRRLSVETVDGTVLKEKIMADRAYYDSAKKEWRLTNVQVRTNNGLKETLVVQPELRRKFPFSPQDLDDDDRNKEALTTPELIRYIERERQRGRESVNFYLIELHKRTAQPFAGFILTIIGACIASRKVRGGSGFHLAMGIVMSALYMLFMQFSQTFSTNAGLNPLIAMWIPNVIFGIVAIYLFSRQIK
ncbi:LptF/LptG family permease [Taibaiella helva]|uniref:LptF/LptG family permease n=1 Tax=Taibaiella helva TaxID=2301235 RepID=UPI0013003D11|nr:LptF/LptG family permease [Taibaiella helva]